jgi:hypothetical protein
MTDDQKHEMGKLPDLMSGALPTRYTQTSHT